MWGGRMSRIENFKKPLRVALVMGKFVTGGIKTVMMSYYNNINRENVQFDFIIDEDSPMDDYSEIFALGGKIHKIPSTKNPIKNVVSTSKVLKKNDYLCVHGYINTLNIFPMFAGKLAKTPVRIAENLSTAHAGERKTMLKNILKPFAKLFPTHIAANSIYAAEWLYGKKSLNRCKIINNALDLEKFKYDLELREKTREKLKVENCFVLGHIGRYHYQKNHDFLVDVFKALYDRDSEARLLLVGYGELKEQIFSKIAKLGLSDVVIDGGATEDILLLYNAMDCFVLPSFYEGLPVVGIEAQATGLPCVMSTEVTKETAITDCVRFIELRQDVDFWAEEILKWKNYKRADVRDQITKSGYNIEEEAEKLEEYYYSCIESESK